jgi:hypothetical protein
MMRLLLTCLSLALTGLLTASAAPGAGALPQNASALAKSGILESNVAYLRVSHVAAGLPDAVTAAIKALSATNKLAGTVLDLRFADGDDSSAATATALLFGGKKGKTLPVAILVNAETRGAAIALATDLRAERAGLVFGEATATVTPDVVVTVKPDAEKAFWDNPYALTNDTNAPIATTNFLPFVDHTSEADLVREKVKDGDEDGDVTPPAVIAPVVPVIHDPVLARAADLIKGLSVIRASRL